MNRSTRKSKPVTRKKKESMRKKRTQRRIKRGGAAAADADVPAVVDPKQTIKDKLDQTIRDKIEQMKKLETSKNILKEDYLRKRQARVVNLLHKGQIEMKKVKGKLGPSVNENDIFNGTLNKLLIHIHYLENLMRTTIDVRYTIEYLDNEIKILEEMQERISEETILNSLKRTGSNLTENSSNEEQSSPKIQKTTTPGLETDNGYDTVVNDNDSNNDG